MFNFLKRLFKRKSKSKPKENKNITSNLNDNLPKTVADINTYNINIHHDLDGLLWFGDGPLKNYSPEEESTKFNIDDFLEIKISFVGQTEPSCIYLNSPIRPVDNAEQVELPGYFPSFQQLTPEQRYLYGLSLTNPYNPNIDISYIFILYYGLERYLFTNKYEDAFNIILKLKKVHNNNSFQHYSTNALFLCSLIHKRKDLFKILKEDMQIQPIDSSKYLFTKMIFNEPLNDYEVVNMARSVDFKNVRYINSHYDLFVETLRSKLINKYGINQFTLGEYSLSQCKNTFTSMLANYSLSKNIRSLELPDPLSIPELREDIYDLINSTHNRMKIIIEAKRILDPELAQNSYAINLCAFTVVELKDILKKHNLPVSGNKYELIVRIIDNIDESKIHV